MSPAGACPASTDPPEADGDDDSPASVSRPGKGPVPERLPATRCPTGRALTILGRPADVQREPKKTSRGSALAWDPATPARLFPLNPSAAEIGALGNERPRQTAPPPSRTVTSAHGNATASNHPADGLNPPPAPEGTMVTRQSIMDLAVGEPQVIR